MVRSLREELEVLGSSPTIVKVALSREDVARYQLPPNMTKLTDTRRAAFVAQHGDISVELDALPAPVLQQMIRQEIEKYMDLPALEQEKQREQQERAQIVEALSALSRESRGEIPTSRIFDQHCTVRGAGAISNRDARSTVTEAL